MANPFSFEGRRVVVTGAASGVGAALVDLLAELGAEHVTAIDLKEPSAPVDTFVQADLSDEAAVEAAIKAVAGPVHALFNNAGVAATLPAPTVMAVNYLALRRLSEGLLPCMPSGAAIANTASIAGGQWARHLAEITELLDIEGWDDAQSWLAARPEVVGDPYDFSKECVQVYTMRSAPAVLRAHGVRTNSVCPAPIDTPLLVDFRMAKTDKLIDWTAEQCGRLATPREIAMVLAFLASDAAGFVNGVNLNVDAGFNAALTTGQLDFSGLA